MAANLLEMCEDAEKARAPQLTVPTEQLRNLLRAAWERGNEVLGLKDEIKAERADANKALAEVHRMREGLKELSARGSATASEIRDVLAGT